MVRIILLHISWDLKWSRTYLNMRGLWFIASSHISCVHQPGRIILLHISLIFKMIEDHFYPLGPGEQKGIAYKFIQGK